MYSNPDAAKFFSLSRQHKLKCMSIFSALILALCVTVAKANDEGTAILNPENTPLPKITFVKESEKTPETPAQEAKKPEIIIKKAPSYQFNKTDPSKMPKQRYQRALQLEVSPDTSPELMQQMAETRCRHYSESLRQDYFVNLVNSHSKAVISTVLCKNVSGPAVRNEEAPQKPSIVETFQKELLKE